MTTPTRYDYKVHWYAELFPPLPFADYEKLKADIRAHGQIHPIVMSREGLLLDGRNRMSICRDLDITPYTVFLDDVHNAKGMSDVEFIDSVNLLRRHLTDDQRIALAAAKAAGLIEQAKEQKKRKPESVPTKLPTQKIDVRKDLAKAAKVSEGKAGAALKLAKEDPDKLKEVAKGTTTLKAASGGGKRKSSGRARRLPEPKPAVTAPIRVLDCNVNGPGEDYELLPPEKSSPTNAALWLTGVLKDFSLYAKTDPGGVRAYHDDHLHLRMDATLLPSLQKMLALQEWLGAVLNDNERERWYAKHKVNGSAGSATISRADEARP